MADQQSKSASADLSASSSSFAPPFIIYRSKNCFKLIRGSPPCKDELVISTTEGNQNCRVESVNCSEDGKLIAWCDSNRIKCVKFDDHQIVFDQENVCKSNCLYISPKSTKLITFSTTTVGDNLHFWDISTQTLLSSMPFRRASQWRPVFSMNEDICIQHINNELLFYTNGAFDKPKHRISHMKINDFSLSTSSTFNTTYQHLYEKRIKNKTHHIAVYTVGSKGQPSIVKIFKYPNMTDCVANKSFFKADRVKFNWSPSGNSLLLLCQSEFDQTGKSYYGEQSLQFMSVKSDSCFVKLPKEGAIAHLEWLPCCDKDMFVCAYGFVPSKVSIFDHKCEIIHDFDEGSFNTATFSPFGNLLAIYGFGNLTGQLNVWNLDKKKQVASVKVPETTGLEWCADGIHFVTYTTTPRLRVNNGFRLWHYSGNLIHEEVCTDAVKNLELYDVLWQPKPNQFKKPKCDSKPSKFNDLLSTSNLQKYQKVAAKYVPPSMRNNGSAGSTFDSAIGMGAFNCPVVGLASLQRPNFKNQRSKLKKKADKSANKSEVTIKDVLKPQDIQTDEHPAPETQDKKKARILNRQLDEIERLKKKQDSGEVLKPNQVVKISNEAILREHLAQLKI